MRQHGRGKGIASAEQIWARLRRGEHFSGTCRYRRRNGGALWIEATYLPQINPAGEVERISVVSRKSIADAERQEEVRLLLLGINETGNAVAVSGPDGRIVYVNEGFHRMLGFGRADAVNQELGELLAGGRPDGGTREELDRRIACREGYHRTCWSTIAPASRYGCLSWPTPCSTSAARWSTWWMC